MHLWGGGAKSITQSAGVPRCVFHATLAPTAIKCGIATGAVAVVMMGDFGGMGGVGGMGATGAHVVLG